jgi:hypothetical protein
LNGIRLKILFDLEHIMKNWIAIAALSLAFASPALAQKRRQAKPAAPAPSAGAPEAGGPAEGGAGASYRAPYGMAGCGIGALVIKHNTKGPQIGAWFLNSLFGSQTFGITSGTSNCKSRGGVAQIQEQEIFVAANMQSLSQEAAQGEGEHLSSFAEVLGCEGAQADQFKKISQAQFSYLFETTDAAAVLSRTHSLIKQKELSCKRV